jgi:hypothetical protein
MTTQNSQEKLNNLCHAAIKERLGDMAWVTADMKSYIFEVYREFIAGYLNFLRQKENKPADWVPDSMSIDFKLVDGMRHFFSDYQHITKKFYTLNKEIDRLCEIDKERQPNLYRHMIDDILRKHHPRTVGEEEHGNSE